MRFSLFLLLISLCRAAAAASGCDCTYPISPESCVPKCANRDLKSSTLLVNKLNDRIADRNIPADVAAKAKCIIVLPGSAKGVPFGQDGHEGVATCRNGNQWSAPLAV